MSEYSSTSENSDRSESKKASLWDRIKTAKQVAVSSNYDLDVDPQAYEAYVTSTGRRIEHARVLADLMERYLPTTSGEEQACVLDIAAGTGIISRSLAEKGYSVTATDVSQNALHYLNEQSSGIETVHADMNEKLPFEDESFEGVTSVWANRFIKDTDAFLSDVHRILKPGGVFVWPIFPTEQPIWKWKNGMAQHTSTKSLANDALRLGFSEVQTEHVSLGEARTRKFPLHTIPHYLLARK